ncbi:hypothetical protein ZOSMA_106G00070 [Zostera marina]|uniref:C2H2-type domain-containing protein n=1 Tax=Zostera marina TaxID=29655 RepID=A0A0K9Q601_ZOSMR|nr:hypothetical protein ZOSMA_106G00070 [Zostera marina]
MHPNGNNEAKQGHHHLHSHHNQHKNHHPASEMDLWRANNCMSMLSFYTSHEKLAIEHLFLLHKEPSLKLLERRRVDAQNEMIFSKIDTIADNPIIKDRKLKYKLEDTHEYKCKTFNKRCASFQALNDHQISYKKPKMTTVNDDVHNTFNQSRLINHEDINMDISMGNLIFPIGSSSMPASSNCNIVTKDSKFYECSICGVKYCSGQALGGHMRKHRKVVQSGQSLIRHSPQSTHHSIPFPFDLNLPAPDESDLAKPTHPS